MKLINIGYGNMVASNRIISIVSPESAPIKRLVQEARDSGNAIDATYGRKTRAVIIMTLVKLRIVMVGLIAVKREPA